LYVLLSTTYDVRFYVSYSLYKVECSSIVYVVCTIYSTQNKFGDLSDIKGINNTLCARVPSAGGWRALFILSSSSIGIIRKLIEDAEYSIVDLLLSPDHNECSRPIVITHRESRSSLPACQDRIGIGMEGARNERHGALLFRRLQFSFCPSLRFLALARPRPLASLTFISPSALYHPFLDYPIELIDCPSKRVCNHHPSSSCYDEVSRPLMLRLKLYPLYLQRGIVRD
jgi:hypothetical protein